MRKMGEDKWKEKKERDLINLERDINMSRLWASEMYVRIIDFNHF